MDIAFLRVIMPRPEELPFCFGDNVEGEPGDGSWTVPLLGSRVADRGDIERMAELAETEVAEREKAEEAYGPSVGAGDRYASFSGTGGGRSRLKRLNLLPVAVIA